MDRRSQLVPPMASSGSADPLALALETPSPTSPSKATPQGRFISPQKNAATFPNCNFSTLTSSPTSELVYVATVTERGVNGKVRIARVGGQGCGAKVGGTCGRGTGHFCNISRVAEGGSRVRCESRSHSEAHRGYASQAPQANVSRHSEGCQPRSEEAVGGMEDDAGSRDD